MRLARLSRHLALIARSDTQIGLAHRTVARVRAERAGSAAYALATSRNAASSAWRLERPGSLAASCDADGGIRPGRARPTRRTRWRSAGVRRFGRVKALD